MDATKRLFLPVLTILMLSAAFGAAMHVERASAQVPYPAVSPYLSAAIRADLEAAGHQYGGDCKFDVMYLAPGTWCSTVQSVGPDGAIVNYGPFASDDIKTARFVRTGEYGWKNPATGVGSPERVPLLSARPGEKPDSWVVTGINHPANQEVVLFDGSACGGEQRCPGDHRLATVRADQTGAFVLTVQFDPAAKPIPGQVYRLIQSGTGNVLQVAFHQDGSAPKPTPADPTPGQPAADPTPSQPAPAPIGDTDDSGENNALVVGMAAVLGLAALGSVGVVALIRR